MPDDSISQTAANVVGVVQQFGHVSGNVLIVENKQFRITAADSARPIDTTLARESPSKLLRAGYATVPFVGREPQLAELSEWLTTDGQRSVRLIHGPGGQGKTRLLAVFAQRCMDSGWAVWQARQGSADAVETEAESAVPEAAPGLVVLVDYAERWRLQDLLGLMRHSALRPRCPVRVLMAARPTGSWWALLRAGLDQLEIQANAIALPPLGEQVDRRDMFISARDSFAAVLGVQDAKTIAPPADLRGDAYQVVLAVHMAALAAVDAHHAGVEVPTDPVRVSTYLLDRERLQWKQLYDASTVHTSDQVMSQAVFVATLTRPQPYRLGAEALRSAVVTSTAEGTRQVLTDHALCYPPVDQSTVLEPLYPDRLGEDFLALQTPGHSVRNYDPDPWAGDAIDTLVALSEGDAAPPWIRQSVAVLVAAAARWPHLRGKVYELLGRTPQLAIDAGSPTLTALAELPDINIALLEAIDARFPEKRNADLNAGIAAIATGIAEHRLAATDDPGEQADLLKDLGMRLSGAGDRESARSVIWTAASAYRDLAEHDPAGYEPKLAGSLAELGTLLASEDSRLALAATEEAAELYGRLAQADPDTYEPRLAMALNDLGNRLGDADTTRQAVQIFERLAAKDGASFEPKVAITLTNLANHLGYSGEVSEAQQASRKAVDILSRLAQTDAGLEPALANALNTLGMLSASPDESLEVTERAVSIAGSLAADDAEAYGPSLGVYLSNLALRLKEAGRGSDAVTAAQEAVSTYERLTESRPAAFERKLAESQLAFATLCADEGTQLASALEAADKSISIYRMMPYLRYGVFSTDFEQVGAWFVKADVLTALGRTDEAERITSPLIEKGWPHP